MLLYYWHTASFSTKSELCSWDGDKSNRTNFELILIEFFELQPFHFNRIANCQIESNSWKFDSTLLLESNQTNQIWIDFHQIFRIFFPFWIKIKLTNLNRTNLNEFERISNWLYPYFARIQKLDSYSL